MGCSAPQAAAGGRLDGGGGKKRGLKRPSPQPALGGSCPCRVHVWPGRPGASAVSRGSSPQLGPIGPLSPIRRRRDVAWTPGGYPGARPRPPPAREGLQASKQASNPAPASPHRIAAQRIGLGHRVPSPRATWTPATGSPEMNASPPAWGCAAWLAARPPARPASPASRPASYPRAAPPPARSLAPAGWLPSRGGVAKPGGAWPAVGASNRSARRATTWSRTRPSGGWKWAGRDIDMPP